MSEREISSSEAFNRISNIIQTLGLKARARYVDDGYLVATAELYNEHGTLVESGAGKGPEALIGALAESLEHYAMFHANLPTCTTLGCDAIASQNEVKSDGIFTSLQRNNESLQCLHLSTLDGGAELFVPCTLLYPIKIKGGITSQSTRFLNRYASNSGAAFGCTKSEALLHGTLELLERHLMSRFFMAVCMLTAPMKLYTPSATLLAQALSNNSYALQAAEDLQIIIIKDKPDVYLAIALPRSGPGNRHISAIGSGCSLDIYTAIQRAVTEQFQSATLYDAKEEIADRKTLDVLCQSEKLKQLIDFAPVKDLKLDTLPISEDQIILPVREQLTFLQKSQSDIGKTIFYRTVMHYSGSSVVTQAYIPGLERFNIIRNGQHVVPQHILLGTERSPAACIK